MLGRASVLLVTLVCGAAFAARVDRPEAAPPRADFTRFPRQIVGWTSQELPPIDPKVLALLGADDILNRAYYRTDHRAAAGLYVGYYKSQRQGDAIHSPMNCLPGAGWEPLATGYLPIAVEGPTGPTTVSVNRYIIQKGIDRQLVLYWYQSHGRVVANEYWSKFYLIRDAMILNRTDAALVRVIVPMASGVDDAEQVAESQAVEFVKGIFPILPRYLPS